MSKARTPIILGLAAASGVGYYLYNSGGSAKAAEKQFESDMHRAAASAKSHLPGSKPDAEKEMKHYGAEAGAKIDSAVAGVDKTLGQAKSNTEAMAKGAKASVLQGIDKADRKIEDGAAKAKGWFGGSSK